MIKVDFWKCNQCDFQTTLKSERRDHIKDNVKWKNGEPVDNPDVHILTNLKDV